MYFPIGTVIPKVSNPSGLAGNFSTFWETRSPSKLRQLVALFITDSYVQISSWNSWYG